MNVALSNCGLKYMTEHLNSLIDLDLSPEDDELIKVKDCISIPLEHVEKIIFEYTSECNFSCKHCYNGKIDRATEIDTETLKKAVDVFVELGIYDFAFVGGEVSAFGNGWLDVCRHIDSHKEAYASLYTNGWWIDKKNFTAAGQQYKDDNEYLASLKKNGLSILKFSIDGYKEVHDISRGHKGLYNRVLNVMDLVHDAGLMPRLSLLMDSNDMKGFNNIIFEIGPKIYRDISFKNQSEILAHFSSDLNNTISSFIDIGNGADDETKRFDPADVPEEYYHCKGFYRPAPTLTIKANGELATCRVTNAGEGYGNLHSESITDILNNMQNSFIFKLHAEKKVYDYLPYFFSSVFGNKFGHMCTLRAILTLIAVKMEEQNTDPDDREAILKINREVAVLTGHLSDGTMVGSDKTL
jgi:sulfatase maturation enzyme AslB (radical SAM superfamily)